MVDSGATRAFLDDLKALWPKPSAHVGNQDQIPNPYYIIAAVGFSALNCPDAMPIILEHTTSEANSLDQKKCILRKLRDGLFKSGMTAGYAKVINAMLELKNATPNELAELGIERNTSISLEEMSSMGHDFFAQTYGAQASTVQDLLNSIYGDLGYLSNTLAYGWVYSFPGNLTAVETSFVLVASLVAGDTPRQIKWHLDGARRNGASDEEVQAVRRMAISVAHKAGLVRKHDVPEIY